MSIIGVLAILATFTLVVFIHELGHYLVAKHFNVRVEKFSIGFGPELFGFWRGETRFCVSAIPLGGFVKMSGEDPSECVGSPREFYSQPWHKRLVLLVAGPLMNIVLAFALVWIGFTAWGVWEPSKDAVVGEVISPSPAERAGLKPNDVILAAGSQVVHDWTEMSGIIRASAGKQLDMVIIRGEARMTIRVKPDFDPKRKVGFIGIAPLFTNTKMGVFEAFRTAADHTVSMIIMLLSALFSMVTGAAKPDLIGPIGLGAVIAKSAAQGLATLVNLIAIISVNLGVLNLLPIPVLDGGHVMFCLIQAVRRRPVDIKWIQYANTAGMALLLMLMVFVIYTDIVRFVPVKPAPPVQSGQTAP